MTETSLTTARADHAFGIALTILIIFGVILGSVAIIDIARDDEDFVTDISAVASIFSGWLATVITFFFHEKQIQTVERTADAGARQRLKGKASSTPLERVNDNKAAKFKSVIAMKPKDKLGDAFNLIYHQRFHSVPFVEDNDELKGMITKKVLSNYWARGGKTLKGEGLEGMDLVTISQMWRDGELKDKGIEKLLNKPLSKVRNEMAFMLEEAESMTETDTMEKALENIRVKGTKAIPLVDKDNVIKGMVTEWDMLDYLEKLYTGQIEGEDAR